MFVTMPHWRSNEGRHTRLSGFGICAFIASRKNDAHRPMGCWGSVVGPPQEPRASRRNIGVRRHVANEYEECA